MSVSVSFDLKKLERRLTEIEKVFLPQAAEQALKQFGFESRKTLADEMKSRYQTATNYTLRSPRYKVEGQTLTVSILDDPKQNQSAAKYLEPTDRSRGVQRKPIQPTTLAGVMRRFGTSKLPIPQPNTRVGRQFIASNGNLKSKKVQSLIAHLTSPNPTGSERYFVIAKDNAGLRPGIWRRYRIKDEVSLAFALVDQKPKVDTRLDFHGLVLRDAEKRLPGMVEDKLRRLLR